MVRTSNSIHDSALKSTLNAPIRFFEANPVGRILNRFSRDQSVVDESFPMTSFDFVRTAIVSIGAIVLVMIGNPWVLFSLVLFVPIFLILRKRYISTSRELKRMDGVTKSPVFEHFSASLEGLVSIRAFTYQATAFQEFLSKVDINNRVWFSFTVVSRWIGFRMDFSVAIILISTALLAVIARNSINPGVVAVSLTYVIQISGLLQWCVRLSAEVENSMTSFERLFRYCNIEPEELDGDKIVPPNDWPKQGKLEIKDLKVRYREGLPYSIKYLNTSVDHAEKIGVCGRTGSGKSTLFKTCFRLVNPTEGSILIDGVDICKIPLNNLRSMLSIIPQDPVIFSGTLRYNLDPFGEYSDERIENVLDVLELRKLISRLPKGIYTEIAESGGNLSVGESQLICVARALLKPSKILFIDEATSNIDKETDRLIQKVIRSEFSDRTVLVIAHRLDTIIDSDRIFVLDSGEIAEIGNAKQLFQRKDGIFRSMAEQAGISLSLQSI
jgi:ABC-type multidrug transport system fused ATPase/permease subunit